MAPSLRSSFFPCLLAWVLLLAQVVLGLPSERSRIVNRPLPSGWGTILAFTRDANFEGKRVVGCLDGQGFWTTRRPPCRARFRSVPLDGVGYVLQAENGRYLSARGARGFLSTVQASKASPAAILHSMNNMIDLGNEPFFRAGYSPNSNYKAGLFPASDAPAENNPLHMIVLQWRPIEDEVGRA